MSIPGDDDSPLDDAPDERVARWTTRSSRTVYDNPWIEVSHREVRAPTGRDGIYGMVHFKNRAVGVVPLDDEAHTWLVGQWRYPLDAWSWEIPEGGAPAGEATLDCARRELAEETGLTASRWSPLLKLHTSNSVTDELGVVYLARGLTPGTPAPDDTERLVVRRVSLDEAVAMVLDGRITDSLAMTGLMKAQLLRLRGELPV